MIKGSIQEDIIIINIYAPNIGALQYVRQMFASMKGEINNTLQFLAWRIPGTGEPCGLLSMGLHRVGHN